MPVIPTWCLSPYEAHSGQPWLTTGPHEWQRCMICTAMKCALPTIEQAADSASFAA